VSRDRSRGFIALVATAVALAGGQAMIGSAGAASTVTVTPTSPTMTPYTSPFGESETWGAYMVWVYKNVPAFALKPGDSVAFDLSAQNDVDIQLQIAMAPATTNGGNQNGTPFTQIIPNTQTPANPRGNTTFGDYELTFTAAAPFNFSGGGLLIRFGSPAGAFATDPNDPGATVLANNALPTDPSGYFVERDVRDIDGTAPWTGDAYFDGIGGFRLNIADVQLPPTSTPLPAPPYVQTPLTPPKKKCKKKHKRAAAAKKCKKKKH
jgi:hypothetical protein